MADNIPNLPSGAVPPKPSEPAKVQPKKETVRINLPPKPSASPTIKLPTLPAGGPPPPSSAAAPAASPPASAPAPGSAVQPPRAPAAPRPAAAPGATTSARVATAATARPAPAPAPRHTPAPQISGVDKGLAIGAAVISVIALASVLFLMIVENAS